MTKYYLDACIWIDIYNDRKDFRGRSLSDPALVLLSYIRENKHRIVMTDLLFNELKRFFSTEEINGMFKPFERLTEIINVNKKQRNEAVRLSIERNIPKGDILHAIIARDNNLILITRDNHFKRLRDIVIPYKPEDLI